MTAIYSRNLQGDVVELYQNGTLIAKYEYDAWGAIESITDAGGNAITSASHAARINPFRYRGYYYDEETGFYYLNSRYYDPVVKRFINADTPSSVTDETNQLHGKNLFAYCDNNPVNRVDANGQWWDWISNVVSTIAQAAIVVATAAVITIATGGIPVIAALTGLAVSTVTTATVATAAAGVTVAAVSTSYLIASTELIEIVLKDNFQNNLLQYKEHTANKRKSSWDKHTSKRAGDSEKGDEKRMQRKDTKKSSPNFRNKGRIHSKR